MNAEFEDAGSACNRPGEKSTLHWLKQFLVGNPFYIVSAAFLLFGIYRLSAETLLSEREMRQLIFNFSALQVYELLLTCTALFLARKRIWYDSTLLIVIGSGLVLVPFLLVSQAISLSKGMAHLICGMTALLAGIKFSALKKFYPRLNLPPALLCSGALILTANALLPLYFKSIAESDHAALVLDIQEAGVRLALTGILPALAALAVFLPRSSEPDELPQQKKWLPLLIHFLWITATAVHFYSIRYVYKTPFEVGYFAPLAWVLAWLLFNRMPTPETAQAGKVRNFLMVPPMLVALPIFWPGKVELSGYLLLGNLILYALIYFRDRTNHLPLQLTLLSLAAVMTEMPKDFWQLQGIRLSAGSWTLFSAAIYTMFAAATSRNPKVGLAGAICAAAGTGVLLRDFDPATHFALQIGLAFALIHSIAWRDFENPGAKFVRVLLVIAWVAHSFLWSHSHSEYSFVLPAGIAAAVVISFCAFVVLGHIRGSRLIPFAAGGVWISTPANFFFEKTSTASLGILCVAGSFLLFAFGTWFALIKAKRIATASPGIKIKNPEENPPD